MPRSHAAPFDPLIAQQTMIAKTESSVFLTGRPAKPAFNSRNFSFTCHTHSVWRRVFGDSAIVPWNGCAWHCDAFQASVHPHTHTHTHEHGRTCRHIHTHKSLEARHRHTDTDVEWRRARESRGIFWTDASRCLSIAGLSRLANPRNYPIL